jgi:hypothetical protein
MPVRRVGLVTVRVKPKAAVAAEKNVKRQFQDSWLSDFA